MSLSLFLQMFRFFIAYKTLRTVIVDPNSQERLLVFTKTGMKSFPRYCPHEGADLFQHGTIKNEMLQCGWHGCRLKGLGPSQ